MEVAVINRFSGLESGISSLPNPTFISQIFSSLSNLEITLYLSFDFFKWSALILALLATFSGLINRLKILFRIFQRRSKPLLLQDFGDSDDDFSVHDTASSVSSSWSDFEEDDEEEEKPTTSSRSWDLTDEDFHVRGSDYYLNDRKSKRTMRLRQRRSFQNRDGDSDQSAWTDFDKGKSVVKLWDNLRLGLEQELQIPSSKLLFSSGEGFSGEMMFNLWDTRVGFQIPALIAEWKPISGKIIGINDRKVYVREEDDGEIMLGDMRKVSSPVEKITTVAAAAADVETWWDADAVLVAAD